jgi:hypothetical protein
VSVKRRLRVVARLAVADTTDAYGRDRAASTDAGNDPDAVDRDPRARRGPVG